MRENEEEKRKKRNVQKMSIRGKMNNRMNKRKKIMDK